MSDENPVIGRIEFGADLADKHIADEIKAIRERGSRFITPIPIGAFSQDMEAENERLRTALYEILNKLEDMESHEWE